MEGKRSFIVHFEQPPTWSSISKANLVVPPSTRSISLTSRFTSISLCITLPPISEISSSPTATYGNAVGCAMINRAVCQWFHHHHDDSAYLLDKRRIFGVDIHETCLLSDRGQDVGSFNSTAALREFSYRPYTLTLPLYSCKDASNITSRYDIEIQWEALAMCILLWEDPDPDLLSLTGNNSFSAHIVATVE